MIKKRHIVLCFLVFCLTATLLVGVTSSVQPYDPWCDINNDALVDIVDIVNLALRFGESGTPIDKAAIAYNSTVVYDNAFVTEPWTFVDMPGTNVTITLVRPSDLLIMFSSEACTNASDGRIQLGAMVDYDYASPYGVYFTPTVSAATTDGHSHTLRHAAYAYNFLYYNASAGTHTVKIQWCVTLTYPPTEGNVFYRTLAVLAVNQ